MRISIFDDRLALAKAAAEHAVEAIQRAIAERKSARIIAAAGESQIDFLRDLTAHREVDWAKVEVFCIGEYLGLPADHPASIRRFLQDRLVAKTGIKQFHFLEVNLDQGRAMAEIGLKLRSSPVDIAFLEIGENGQLGMNIPPADFETEEPYLAVDLDFNYRLQQVNEGWFVEMGQAPMQAVAMSVRQIMKAKEILAIVPGRRRALAVRVCIEHGISPTAPASILSTHPNTAMYLDRDSAAQLAAEGKPQALKP